MRIVPLIVAILFFSAAAFASDIRDFDNTTISLAVDTPTPPTNPSGIGAANPDQVPLEWTTLLTVTVTPGMNPTSTGLTVTGDLSLIGGPATQTFYDDGER